MIEINLMPDVKQELLHAQRLRSTVVSIVIVIGIAAAAIVTILALWVFGAQAVRSTLADNAIQQGSDQLAEVEDLAKTLTIQNQLSLVSNLNNGKKINSRLFDVLSAVVPPAPNNVTISNLILDSAEGAEMITIEGQAAGSYSTVELFQKTLDAAEVVYVTDDEESDGSEQRVKLADNIAISETSYGQDADGSMVLRFKLTFTYAAELFSPASKNVRIDISKTGNVTDSYLDIPRSIFADRVEEEQ